MPPDVTATAVVIAAAAAAPPCILAATLARRMAAELARLSPHARLLGRRVMVRKYDGSDWEPATVVCVSHHGSLCIRRDGERRGWWMDAHRVPGRVMIMEEERWRGRRTS